MIVAGVGCRQGASAAAIETVIAAALERAGLTPQGLDVLATAAFKGDEPGIAAAAAARGVPLILVAQADLTGVGSVAEAAALAAAGPAGRLMVARIAIGPATCALARSEVASSEVATQEAAP
jgi:cobalt-precorrin 5A hydrolase